jgi:hypothetical protein
VGVGGHRVTCRLPVMFTRGDGVQIAQPGEFFVVLHVSGRLLTPLWHRLKVLQRQQEHS